MLKNVDERNNTIKSNKLFILHKELKQISNLYINIEKFQCTRDAHRPNYYIRNIKLQIQTNTTSHYTLKTAINCYQLQSLFKQYSLNSTQYWVHTCTYGPRLITVSTHVPSIAEFLSTSLILHFSEMGL